MRQCSRGLCAAVLACLVTVVVATEAGAAVLCQRNNKVKIRATACKGKETQVQDLQQLGVNLEQLGSNVQQVGASVQQLGTDVGAQSGRLGAEVARIDHVFGQLRLECADPALVKVETNQSFFFDDIDCRGGCRAHDGDQAGCESAWATSEWGATSCFFFDGLCLPCGGCGEEEGACTNTCAPQVVLTCPNDPTRTTYVGGGLEIDACLKLTTLETCQQGFAADDYYSPASCFWSGGQCRRCDAGSENGQDCTNTCRTIQCADPMRTTLRRCDDVGNDAGACAQTWHLAGLSGEASSCYFDNNSSQCRGCGLPNEFRGRCVNACR
jgi:hypothetical protein